MGSKLAVTDLVMDKSVIAEVLEQKLDSILSGDFAEKFAVLIFQINNYMFKDNNRNTKWDCWLCLKSTIKTRERCQST